MLILISHLILPPKCYLSFKSYHFVVPGNIDTVESQKFEQEFQERTPINRICNSQLYFTEKLATRALDPDPHSFSLLDPDPGGKI